MYTGKIRQILLITDGCSNQGEDPIAMAALAKEQGITVNVIGVVEQDIIDEKGMTEIEGIALSGGGVSQIVYAQALSQTVQMVTRKAMNHHPRSCEQSIKANLGPFTNNGRPASGKTRRSDGSC